MVLIEGVGYRVQGQGFLWEMVRVWVRVNWCVFRFCDEEDCDVRMVKMCQGILKAIDSRPDDKYVAYRKVYAFCVS